MSKKLIMSVLNEVATQWANKQGFELVQDEDYDPSKDFHPVNIVNNATIRQLMFRDTSSDARIETRQRFGNPRIGIYGTGKEWFVALEYNADGTFSEAQLFYPKSIEMLPVIKNQVDEMIKLVLDD